MLSCTIEQDIHTMESGLIRSMETTVTKRCEASHRDTQWKKNMHISRLPEYVLVHIMRFSWRPDTLQKAKILKTVTFPLLLDLLPFCTLTLREIISSLHVPSSNVPGKATSRTSDEASETLRKTKPLGLENEELSRKHGAIYELRGVISHKGRTGDSGHYVAWIRGEEKMWTVEDDIHSAFVEDKEILRLCGGGEGHTAYVLLYHARPPGDHDL